MAQGHEEQIGDVSSNEDDDAPLDQYDETFSYDGPRVGIVHTSVEGRPMVYFQHPPSLPPQPPQLWLFAVLCPRATDWLHSRRKQAENCVAWHVVNLRFPFSTIRRSVTRRP